MSNYIEAECPHCKEGLEIDSDLAGMNVDCPKCSGTLKVPFDPAPESIPEATVNKSQTEANSNLLATNKKGRGGISRILNDPVACVYIVLIPVLFSIGLVLQAWARGDYIKFEIRYSDSLQSKSDEAEEYEISNVKYDREIISFDYTNLMPKDEPRGFVYGVHLFAYSRDGKLVKTGGGQVFPGEIRFPPPFRNERVELPFETKSLSITKVTVEHYVHFSMTRLNEEAEEKVRRSW
jgi:hypothetical protein